MLVAFASFVLHGWAMARVAPMHASTSAADHHHGGDGAHGHHHATAEASADHDADGTDRPDHHGSKGMCCGSFCATAITPSTRDAAMSCVASNADLPTFEARGQGIPDEGPRKPPRTLDIA